MSYFHEHNVYCGDSLNNPAHFAMVELGLLVRTGDVCHSGYDSSYVGWYQPVVLGGDIVLTVQERITKKLNELTVDTFVLDTVEYSYASVYSEILSVYTLLYDPVVGFYSRNGDSGEYRQYCMDCYCKDKWIVCTKTVWEIFSVMPYDWRNRLMLEIQALRLDCRKDYRPILSLIHARYRALEEVCEDDDWARYITTMVRGGFILEKIMVVSSDTYLPVLRHPTLQKQQNYIDKCIMDSEPLMLYQLVKSKITSRSNCHAFAKRLRKFLINTFAERKNYKADHSGILRITSLNL